MSFSDALRKVLDIEAGYSNDPEDRGGETICGISRVYWPDWEGWLVVDRMKEKGLPPQPNSQLIGLAKQLYRVNFWNRVRGDELGDTLGFELFEMAVNMSVNRASLILQDALNLLNRNERSWPELLLDGAIGPATLKTVHMIQHEHGGEQNLVRLVNALQAEYYINLARTSPTQERFLRGWLKRT